MKKALISHVRQQHRSHPSVNDFLLSMMTHRMRKPPINQSDHSDEKYEPDDFLSQQNVMGGPVYPLTNVQGVINYLELEGSPAGTDGGQKNHVHATLEKLLKLESKLSSEIRRANGKRNYYQLENKALNDQKSCNYAFAKYLIFMSERVNHTFYDSVLKFVLLYQDCLNLYGDQKVAQLQGVQYQLSDSDSDNADDVKNFSTMRTILPTPEE